MHTLAIPPCLTGKGNGFSPFGEPQTRGAAGPFQIPVLLKTPSVYEYGDEDLEKQVEGGGKFEGGKDQRVKRGRDSMSLRGFPPCPVALGWIYALDLEDYQSVCLCVCCK